MQTPDFRDQHLCPNPLCQFFFPSIDDLCAHLSVPRTTCANWAQRFINDMLSRAAIEDSDIDDFDGELMHS